MRRQADIEAKARTAVAEQERAALAYPGSSQGKGKQVAGPSTQVQEHPVMTNARGIYTDLLVNRIETDPQRAWNTAYSRAYNVWNEQNQPPQQKMQVDIQAQEHPVMTNARGIYTDLLVNRIETDPQRAWNTAYSRAYNVWSEQNQPPQQKMQIGTSDTRAAHGGSSEFTEIQEQESDSSSALVSEIELTRARRGVEIYKRLVETAPTEEIKIALTGKKLKPYVQAMCMKIKPVFFDGHVRVYEDLSRKRTEKVPSEDQHRRWLIQAEALYKQVVDHIIATDNDFHAVDKIYRDYSRKDDPDLYNNLSMVEGDHALYVESTVRIVYDTYPKVFNNTNKSSIDSHILYLLPNPETNNQDIIQYGLLCGFTYKAAVDYAEESDLNYKVKLPGIVYMSSTLDKERELFERKVAILFERSGMNEI